MRCGSFVVPPQDDSETRHLRDQNPQDDSETRYLRDQKSGAGSLLNQGPPAADSVTMVRRTIATHARKKILLAVAIATLGLVGCTGGAAGTGPAAGASITAPGVAVQLGGAGSDNATALQ